MTRRIITKKEPRNCLRTDRAHQQIKARKYLAAVDKSFCCWAYPFNLIERINKLIHAGEIFRDDDTCCVSRVLWNDKNAVVRKYNHKGLVYSLFRTPMGSRARRDRFNAHRLEKPDIAAPRPPAYIEERREILIWKSYFVNEYIEGRRICDLLGQSDVT